MPTFWVREKFSEHAERVTTDPNRIGQTFLGDILAYGSIADGGNGPLNNLAESQVVELYSNVGVAAAGIVGTTPTQYYDEIVDSTMPLAYNPKNPDYFLWGTRADPKTLLSPEVQNVKQYDEVVNGQNQIELSAWSLHKWEWVQVTLPPAQKGEYDLDFNFTQNTDGAGHIQPGTLTATITKASTGVRLSLKKQQP
jgi:hypothetical protein